MPPKFEANEVRVTAAVLQAIEEIDSEIRDRFAEIDFLEVFATAHRDLIETLRTMAAETVTSHDKIWAQNVLWTNVELRRNWRLYELNNKAFVLHEKPAQELILDNLIIGRKRAIGITVQTNGVDWQKRWKDAHGQLVEGRMVALKSHLIWRLISGFLLPFPPFANESSMGLRDIARSEAVRLGLLDETTVVKLSPIDRPVGVVW